MNVVLYRELYHLARTSYIYHVSSVMKYIEMFLSYQINGNLHKLYNYWYFLFPRTITVLRSGNLKINVKYINLHKKQTIYNRVRVMVFNTTFNNMSVISWQRKLEYPEKTTDQPQVTDKFYHIMLYTLPERVSN